MRWPGSLTTTQVLGGLRLLTRRERVRAGALVAGMIAASGLEIIAITLVLPFVQVVIQPESLRTNAVLARVHAVVGTPDVGPFVTWLGLGVIAVMAVSALANWLLLSAQHRFAASCQIRLATHILDRCLQAPYPWFLARNSVMLSRLVYDDVALWSRGLVHRVLQMGNKLVTLAMALTVIALFSVGTGLLVIIGAALLGLGSIALTRPVITRLAAEKRTALDAVTMTANQTLAGIKDIKLSSREPYFSGLFRGAYTTVATRHAGLNMWQETPTLAMQLLAQGTLVALALVFWNMGIGAGQIATQLALLIVVTTKVVPALSALALHVSHLVASFPHVDAIRAALDTIDAETARVTRAAGAPIGAWHRVEFDHAGYRYRGASEWALSEVSLRLARGGMYAFVGPSAAGKSTLVDLLVGLLEPESGHVSIDGCPLTALDRKDWQRRIGYVPQAPFIADDSLRANVAFGVARADVDDARVLECLTRANLADLPGGLEHGLDTRLGERGLRVSGGQRQRIAIARALYHGPELLVFDEATSALDSISEAAVLSALDNLRGRTTLVVIAHRLTSVLQADTIFVLDGGRLVGQGPYAELYADHPLFRRLAAGVEAAPVPA